MGIFICKICQKECGNINSLRSHSIQKHNISSEKIYLNYVLNGVKPKCECGCGEIPSFISVVKGYSKFVQSHHNRVPGKNNYHKNPETHQKAIKTQKKNWEEGKYKGWWEDKTPETIKKIEGIKDKLKNNKERGKKISKKLKGKPKSPQFIKNISKPVLQYNLKGELIKEWESISHANISLNKPPNASSISLCIMGKYKKAFGFVWKFKDETTPTTKIKTNHFNIIQLTLDGDFIAEYENATTASKKIGINSGSIWFCLNGKHKSAGGFIWKYKIDRESYE